MLSNELMTQVATEIRGALPTLNGESEHAYGLGGLLAKFAKLAADLEAHSVKDVIADVLGLLGDIVGPIPGITSPTAPAPSAPAPTGGVVVFKQQAAALKFDWKTLVGTLLKLLPGLLGIPEVSPATP